MQKINYWILGLLLILIGITAVSFFSKKDASVESLRSQNDSLRVQLNNIKRSVDLIDANLKTRLSKVDSSIAVSRQSISSIESNITNVRYNLSSLRQTNPENYYNSLSKADNEKLKKLMYQDVTWE